jgi:hypothetical protein
MFALGLPWQMFAHTGAACRRAAHSLDAPRRQQQEGNSAHVLSRLQRVVGTQAMACRTEGPDFRTSFVYGITFSHGGCTLFRAARLCAGRRARPEQAVHPATCASARS